MENTAYYPCNEPLSPTCHGGTIAWRIVKNGNGNSLRIALTGLPVTYDEWDRTIPILLSPAQRTHLKMKTYVQGVHRNIAYFKDIQASFAAAVGTAQHCGNGPCLTPISEKPALRRPMRADLPTNNDELKIYVDWVKSLENVVKLQDDWGHELKFSLVHGQLTCQSDGADGLFNTKDDIEIQAPKSS